MGSAKGRGEPVMTDVAKLAGVSHQTVSRVLNDNPNVKEQTRLRVTAAIAALGYRRNGAARALVTGRSNVIGVLAQSSTLYGPASMLAAFEMAAATAGFGVSVGAVRMLDRTSVTDAVNRHLDQRVAGLVVIAPVVAANEALDGIPGDVPLVTIDGDPERDFAMATVDQDLGGYLATRCLLDAGHGTIWHISGPPDWFDSQGRVRGWRRALEEARVEVPPLIQADWTASSGYRAGQMLSRMPEVTAIFAANDHLALGLLRALHERGRRVPEDVSVVGFDDVPEAAFYIPPLTTIRPDFDSVARASLALLLGQIESGARRPDRRTIEPTLVDRASVAAPPDN